MWLGNNKENKIKTRIKNKIVLRFKILKIV